MTNKNTIFKITLIYLYMYFIGPVIWGLWMIGRLKIITLKEFYNCLFSPFITILLTLYFTMNLLYTRYVIKNQRDITSNKSLSNKIISSLHALKFHFVSMVTFGTIGTTLFMYILTMNKYGITEVPINRWVALKIIIGSLSGTSLVFLFYTLFSTMLFQNLKGYFNFEKKQETKRTFEVLKTFNFHVYIIGLILFIATTASAYIFRVKKGEIVINERSIELYFLLMFLPIIMSLFLYRKSKRKLQVFIDEVNPNSELGGLKLKELKLLKIEKIIPWCFLILFLLLLLFGKIKLWIFILVLGFLFSFAKGRIYCRYICPVNTINRLIEVLYKKIGIEKLKIPVVFKSKYMEFAWLILLGSIFAFITISKIRISIFVIISFLGVLVSAVYVPVFWCKYFCPWGVIFKILHPLATKKKWTQTKKCCDCVKCSKNMINQ